MPPLPPMSTTTPAPSPGPSLLLDVDGMKCGGCVRAVEQRLLAHSGVRQVSVNLLSRSAWLELEPAVAVEPLLADLQHSLAGLGFQLQPRERQGPLPALRQQRQQRHWWLHWRQLFVALVLLLVSSLGHLADAGQLPWRDPWNLLGNVAFHALVAVLALLGPGRPILLGGARAALAGAPSMDTLVALGMGSATLASLVGWLWPAGGWPCFFNEPVMLLGFVLTGRFLEERARWRTGHALEALAALEPEQARLLLGDGPPRPVRVGGLRPGDRLQLLAGDRVPVDAQVLEGQASVDLSSLTGEPLPQAIGPGQELPAGALNLDGTLVLLVQRSGCDSAIARILQLVEQAQARKAPIQGLADRIAGRFTVLVLGLALATFLFWWLWGTRLWPQVLAAPQAAAGHHGGHALLGAAATTPLALALQLAIAVLVVACPCALGLATPAAITVGTGRAARAGVLFRGGDAIETAARLQTVLFDKTGTLSRGRPLLTALWPEEGVPLSDNALLQLAASLEAESRHPLAHALLQEAQVRQLPLLPLTQLRSCAGAGVEGRLQERPGLWRLGRLEWLEQQGVAVSAATRQRAEGPEAAAASLLALAQDQQLLAVLLVADALRPDAAATLALLRQQGLRLGLLSGDRRAAVEPLAPSLGLLPAELAWELRPEQKLARLVAARQQGPVAMVGDGINDAPALAAADLGIAVGTGTQIAQDTADLVVLGDRLTAIPVALQLARRTMAKVRQNLAWAFGYNLLVLPIAAGVLLPSRGLLLSPPLAALLMALSSITVVLNALALQDGSVADAEREG